MLTFTSLQHLFLIYQWQDLFEIAVLSWVLYKVMHLLAHDTQKPLLKYFYIYFSLIIFAYSYNCQTLQILLLVSAPALLTFFIVVHQETLQKNFVALYRPAIYVKKEIWHYGLIQLCQKQASKNQSTAFILEKRHNLETLVTNGISCNATFSPSVCELLYTTPLVFSEHFFLIQYDGTIRGLNVTINEHSVLHSATLPEERELFLTAKTDALLLKMDATTLTFSCIHNNKKLTHLSARTMTTILDTFFEIKTHLQEGTMYENTFDASYKKTELS